MQPIVTHGLATITDLVGRPAAALPLRVPLSMTSLLRHFAGGRWPHYVLVRDASVVRRTILRPDGDLHGVVILGHMTDLQERGYVGRFGSGTTEIYTDGWLTEPVMDHAVEFRDMRRRPWR